MRPHLHHSGSSPEMTGGEKVPAAVVFDIQRFSIHDGPGIRTTVFFKGCPLRCLWCQNPESKRREPQVSFYAENCRGCFRCRDACPQGAIIEDSSRRVNFSLCNSCGRCTEACEFNCLRMIGMEYNSRSLFLEVLKDKDFFSRSEGGLTLSGGEPALHTPFLLNFLPLIKDEGIHVNIETCGYFKWEEFRQLLPFLDMAYFDIKQIDGDKHKEITGVDNRLILENFTRLSGELKESLIPRMPVIPGLNDSEENIRGVSEFLLERGHGKIYCLPYHRLGESKLSRISTEQKPLEIHPPDEERMSQIAGIFEKNGVEVLI